MKRIILSICIMLLFMSICGCSQKSELANEESDSVQSKADIEQTDNQTQEPTVSDEDSFDFDEAKGILEEFVASAAYKEFITDESYLSTLEYVIYDLNADGVPELLMDAGSPAPFFNTWLFALEDEDVVLVTEQYGYGQFRYATEQNMIIGTPEFRPFEGTSYYPFYKLDGTNYENIFSILQDEGIWYYDDGTERMEITEDGSITYFSDAITFEWSPIEN